MMFKSRRRNYLRFGAIAVIALVTVITVYRATRPTPSAGGEGATATNQATAATTATPQAAGDTPPPSVQGGNGQGTSLSYQVQEPSATPRPQGCPIIETYILSHVKIKAGESATLTWETSGENRSATITDLTTGAVASVAVNGKLAVTPASTRTYRLTASGALCTVTQDVVLTVEQ